MAKLIIYSIDGKENGVIEIPSGFEKAVNKAVIHQAVEMYRANQRQGTLDTKTRSQVSGGNKKPFRQKGTGQARQGSSRSPLWHHGGVAFGPHPRDFSFSVPKKVRTAALRESLKARYQEGSIVCVDAITLKAAKTKEFSGVLKTFKISGKKVLALSEGMSPEVVRASRNIRGLEQGSAGDVNAYDILKSAKLFATKDAMEKLLKRLK